MVSINIIAHKDGSILEDLKYVANYSIHGTMHYGEKLFIVADVDEEQASFFKLKYGIKNVWLR